MDATHIAYKNGEATLEDVRNTLAIYARIAERGEGSFHTQVGDTTMWTPLSRAEKSDSDASHIESPQRSLDSAATTNFTVSEKKEPEPKDKFKQKLSRDWSNKGI